MSSVKWMYTIIALVVSIATPYLMFTWDYWWLLLPVGQMLTWIDFVISERPWKNLAIMKASGLSSTEIWTCVFVNTIYYNGVGIYTYRVSLQGEPCEVHFDLFTFILPVIIIVFAGDYLFYVAHRILHVTKYGSRIHLLHHCCVYTSLSTNVFFHPLDLAIEFFGPATLSFLWYYITQDVFTFIVIGTIQQTWYSSTHDENISNHHRAHHEKLDSNYPIYVSYPTPNRNDKIKHMVVY
eukprot:47582_1